MLVPLLVYSVVDFLGEYVWSPSNRSWKEYQL